MYFVDRDLLDSFDASHLRWSTSNWLGKKSTREYGAEDGQPECHNGPR